MASSNAGPITGKERIRIIQGGWDIWIDRPQFTSLLALSTLPNVGPRPYTTPTTILGTETISAWQDGAKITMNAADITAYLAGSGAAPPHPDPNLATTFTGNELIMGHQAGFRVAWGISEITAIRAAFSAGSGGITALQSAMTRPIDVVFLGDSNQDKDGYGWSWSWSAALITKAGMYATPIAIGPNIGGSASPNGWPYSAPLPPTTASPTTGASVGQIAMAFPDYPSQTGAAGTSPGGSYGYLADGATVAAGISSYAIGVNNVPGVNVKARWRCTYIDGTFATGAGSWRPYSRGTTSFNQLALGSVMLTNTGSETRRSTTLDVAADPARAQGFEFQWKQHNVSPVTGPFIGFTARAENLDATSGFSIHRLYGVGGQSMYDMAFQLLSWSDAQLTNYFAETRRLQIARGFDPITVFWFTFGTNDLNETLQPSLGPNPSSAPTSAAAYIDNFQAAVNRIRAIYQLNGWSLSGIKLMLCVSHPLTNTTSNALLDTYRAAASGLVGTYPGMSFLDIESEVSAAQILTNGWYLANGTDQNHLTGPTTKPASGAGSTPPYGYDGITALVIPQIFPS